MCVPNDRRHSVLTAVRGPALGMCWELTGSHVLGREGDLAVDDATLSRTHLRFRARGGVVRCADAGSANGSFCRSAIVRTRIRERWRAVRHGTLIEAGSGAYRVAPLPGPLRERRWGADSLTRLAVPLALAVAMVPFALSGSPWRWAMVAAPLAAVVLLTRTQGREVLRSSHPAHVLLASREGRAFHAEPVVPRELRAMQRPLAGTGWCLIGPHCEQQAIWLAGFLAVHNDPNVLRVTSPWVSTIGEGLEVRFAPEGGGPTTRQAMVTWSPERAPQWAMVLRPPAWAAAGRAWAGELLPTGRDALPSQIGTPMRTPAEVRRHWDRAGVDFRVRLGHSAVGPVEVDLARDGPHALVAGMSGSGKSELLTTWLMELARHNSPALLHLILVDFKGGAAFNHLGELPHCVGVLTDLDPGATRRALASLRAQLHARKATVAAHGCRELAEYNALSRNPLPVLLVVIDEFRALALDHPDLLDQFLHLANQGRSLGVHLIAATQRPGGAVSSDLRANMPLRLCLRVAEAADSLDVISRPDAALLDPVPGRALLQREGLTELQVSWSGDSATVQKSVRQLAALWDSPPLTPPWCPPLPQQLSPTALAPSDFALADEPDKLRQHAVTLPTDLLILGNPGCGRSTAARRAARAALARGDAVWLITADSYPCRAGGYFGGAIDPRQTRLVGELLRHLTRETGPRTLVMDDVELWIDAHDNLHGSGTAASLLGEFIRTARACAIRVVAAAPPDMVHARWARPLTTQLHLAGIDTATAAASGVPRSATESLIGLPVPGRGILLPAATLIQLPQEPSISVSDPQMVPQFLPLPPTAEVNRLPGQIVLGIGAAGVVSVEAKGDIAIVGPPGSGRTEASQLIHSQYPGSVLDGESTSPLIMTASPGALAGAWTAAATRLRQARTVLLLRPDLFPRLPGMEYAAELEPGSSGFAVLVHEGRATALRLAHKISDPTERRQV